MSESDTYLAEQAVGLAVLWRCARPIVEGVKPEVFWGQSVFSERAKESGPVYFVHDDENASPAANELISLDRIDPEAFRRWRDVVKGDVEGWGLSGKCVERVLGEVGRGALANRGCRRGSSKACIGEQRHGVWSRALACWRGGRGAGACREEAAHPERRRQAPDPRILNGPIQLKKILVLRTVVSIPFLKPWGVVPAML